MNSPGWDPKTRTLDCQKCGACCTPEFDDPTYVGLSNADEKRLVKFGKEKYIDNGQIKTTYTKTNGAQCAFLRGTVGKSCHCAIYPVRPKVCRKFTAGDVECLDARRTTFGEDCEPQYNAVFRKANHG